MSDSEINLRVTGKSSQGGRRYMEDAFVVAYQYTEDKMDLEYAFFGIFDGHGGKEAAQYAKNNLLDNIVNLKYFWQDDDDMVLTAIREGFLNTHMAMWKEVGNWPKTTSGLPSTAGTTASIAFIRKGKLYTGHVGDSRIIIGLKEQGTEEWQSESLTIDHKPESPLEKQRILESGGLVMNKSGVERVVWKRPKPGHEGPVLRSTDFEKIPFLAVARSLGDLWSYDYFQQEFAVSPEPDLGVMSLDLTKDKCLVLASDGLWNIMSPQAAVHLVQDVENENKKFVTKFGVSKNIHLTLCNPSRVLVDCALERWNRLRVRADNVSVVTVMLDQIKSSDVGVLREQLALKMNYPRNLPVISLLSKGPSNMNKNDTDVSSQETSFMSREDNNKTGTKDVFSKASNCDSKACAVSSCEFFSNCCHCQGGSTTSHISQDSCCQDCSSEQNKCKACNCSPEDSLPESEPGHSNESNRKCSISQSSSCQLDRSTSSPLQSCSNFLPERFPSPISKTSRKKDAEGIENSPCPFPRWSKSASGRTSLSKLVSWSRVVSHRRKSDPFQQQCDEMCPDELYSLSDGEEDYCLENDAIERNKGMLFDVDQLCPLRESIKGKNCEIKVPHLIINHEENGLDRDLCEEETPSCSKLDNRFYLDNLKSTPQSSSRMYLDEVSLHLLPSSIDEELKLNECQTSKYPMDKFSLSQTNMTVTPGEKEIDPLLTEDLTCNLCSEHSTNRLDKSCMGLNSNDPCNLVESKKMNLEENSRFFMIVDEFGFEKDLCDEDAPSNSVDDGCKSELNNGKQNVTNTIFEEEIPFHTHMTDLDLEEDLATTNVKNDSFKVTMDQLFSLKQTIKRKYPGAEICNSFISSCNTDNSEGDSAQKRRLDNHSRLVKVANNIVES